MVAEGWTLFEKTCEEVGLRELPQLLRQLKAATRPESTSPQVKSQLVKEGEVEVKKEIIKTPIMIKLGIHQYQFKCPNCEVPLKATRSAMDAHIHSEHTKEALFCYLCPFLMYNLDSLQRHEKAEHK